VDSTHVCVFVGRTLARLTAGYFQPALHRVFRNDDRDRISCPFFLRPREDANLEIEKILGTSTICWSRPNSVAPVESLKMNFDLWRN